MSDTNFLKDSIRYYHELERKVWEFVKKYDSDLQALNNDDPILIDSKDIGEISKLIIDKHLNDYANKQN
ncbi:hypothetical protein D7X33_35690 [Butyricicoccus sp. 1XD8-22]|nr:hypothetical protein D7X33_35690 [Butyricicoccus sp. 1XD8-22]